MDSTNGAPAVPQTAMPAKEEDRRVWDENRGWVEPSSAADQEQAEKIMKQTVSREEVVRRRREEEDAELLVEWESAAKPLATSIVGDTDEAVALRTRCLATADRKIRNMAGQTTKVIHFMAHAAQMTDKKTGESFRKLRVVLVEEDGKTFSATSQAVVRCVKALEQRYGAGPWVPPIEVEVREFPLEDGKSYCDMRIVYKSTSSKKETKR